MSGRPAPSALAASADRRMTSRRVSAEGAAHGHPDERAGQAEGPPPGEQSGKRAAGTDRRDHVSRPERQLGGELLGRQRVRRRTRPGGGAAGDDVRTAPAAAEPVGGRRRMLAAWRRDRDHR